MAGFLPNYPNAPCRRSKTSFQYIRLGSNDYVEFFAQSGIYMTSIIHKRDHKKRSSKASPASVSAADVSPSGGAVMPSDKINAGFLLPPPAKRRSQ
ncbi:hypothetical protein CDAR_174191 [Caerostris darwini]|uniref:Uncharacterized protein n=1 Tax=Caerostris darwini TaxID=1538125 RepID=A0AAV4VIS1_9ARAC|nr:hypothetical protein CDAR_174191 [Caerostris darwini]